MPHDPKSFIKSKNYLFKELPAALSACSAESLAYGRCVSEWDNLRKGDCQKEFSVLKQCLTKHLRKK